MTQDIVVKPAVKVADVKRKIEAAFERQADFEAKQIKVNVDNEEVTLEG